LLYQIDHDLLNAKKIPFSVLKNDIFNFVPSYLASSQQSFYKSIKIKIYLLARFIKKLF
jgi:hypothetical protein